MRVGIFTNAYRPFISGVVNSVDVIRKGLLRKGQTPFVFAPEYPGFREEHAGVFRFRSVGLPSTSKVQFPIPIPFSTKLFPKIPRMGLQVIHTHHPFLLGDVGAHFAKKLGVPLVYTFHTQLEQYAHYIPFNQNVVRNMARSTVVTYSRKCDLIIAPSPTIRALLDEYEIETRVETLQNAIDLSRFDGVSGKPTRLRLGLPSEATVLMYAGRTGKEKNLDFLLRAFAELSRRQPLARLVIVGDGAHLESLRDLAAELQLQETVVFAGAVDYHDMPGYFAAADLFVITSVTEVKPLVVLEAMASGLPVAAVAACGTEDTITHDFDGLLSANNLADYTQVLNQAVSDPAARRQMGANARQTVRQYSIEGYTQRLVELYAELVDQKRPTRSRELVGP